MLLCSRKFSICSWPFYCNHPPPATPPTPAPTPLSMLGWEPGEGGRKEEEEKKKEKKKTRGRKKLRRGEEKHGKEDGGVRGVRRGGWGG